MRGIRKGSIPTRRRRSRHVAMALAAVIALVLAACGADDAPEAAPDDDEPAEAPEGGYTIAALTQGPTNAWAAQFDAVLEKVAEERDEVGELLYFGAEGDADRQVTQFENAVAQNPDAIMLVPMGAAAMAGPVERAMNDGTPVVLCSSGVETDNYTTLVSRDFGVAAGENAEWLAEQLGGEGNILMIEGIAGNDTSEQIGGALRDVLEDYPDIEIVGHGYGDFSVSASKELAETFIAAGDQIDGAWGSGGEAVNGILQAFIDAGIDPPPVAGATPENGTLRLASESGAELAAWQFPPFLSAPCLDATLQALAGEDLPEFIDFGELLPGGAGSIYTEDIEDFYRPEYADDYIAGVDEYLDQEDLEALNLIR